MKKMLVLLAACIVNSAFAGARLVSVDVEIGSGRDTEVQTYYSVEITGAGEDVGRPGAYYVGAMVGRQHIGYLTSGGWHPYTGGMAGALDAFAQTPGVARYYHPISGARMNKPVGGRYASLAFVDTSKFGATKEQICETANQRDVELWAGMGSLTPDKEELVQTWHAEKNPRIDANHIRHVYVQTDMQKNSKYWNIGNFECVDKSR